MLSLKVLESNDEISRRMVKALAAAVNQAMHKTAHNIKNRAGNGFRQLFKNTEEYRALDDGLLATHFGIWKGRGRSKADAIIDTVIMSMEVQFSPLVPVGSTLRGGLTVSIIRSDLQEIFGIIDRRVIETFYKSKTYPDGAWLPWAEWLLLRGDDIIVSTHHIEVGHKAGSRSGNAIMVDGGTWRVPPQFSGTADDNWLTRAITRQSRVFTKLVSNIIREELVKGI